MNFLLRLLCYVGFHHWSPPSLVFQPNGLPSYMTRWCLTPGCLKPSQSLSLGKWK